MYVFESTSPDPPVMVTGYVCDVSVILNGTEMVYGGLDEKPRLNVNV
jgi:hypothetical protein